MWTVHQSADSPSVFEEFRRVFGMKTPSFPTPRPELPPSAGAIHPAEVGGLCKSIGTYAAAIDHLPSQERFLVSLHGKPPVEK